VFLDSQRPKGTAFVIGEVGLTTALHEVGYTLSDNNPDYVVIARPGPTASSASRRPCGWWARGSGSSPPIPTDRPSVHGPLPATVRSRP